MVMKLETSPPSGASLPRLSRPRTLQYAAVLAVCIAGARAAPAQTNPPNSQVGQWGPPYMWAAEMDSVGLHAQDVPVKITHGVMIPSGPYRGSVLLTVRYRRAPIPVESNTYYTRYFVLGGAFSPSDLRVIGTDSQYQAPAALPVDAALSAMTFDSDGQLLTVGAHDGSFPSQPGTEAWRLFPGALEYPPLYSFPPGSSIGTISGTPWRKLPAGTSHAREAPVLVTLAEGIIASLGSEFIASGSSLLLGGVFNPVAGNGGTEFWQAVGPRTGGSQWSRTLVPDWAQFTTTEQNEFHTLPPSNVSETYNSVDYGPLPTDPQIDPVMDCRPRFHQLTTTIGGQGTWTKTLYASHDSYCTLGSTATSSNPIGHGWLVRPRYAGSPSAWTNYRSKNPLAAMPGQATDRALGTSVIRHDRLGALGSGHTGKNRVFNFGGRGTAAPDGNQVVRVVQEYDPGTVPWDGTWTNQPVATPPQTDPADSGRICNNAVILPTGDILVTGGARSMVGFNAAVSDIRTKPQIFKPAAAGATSGWTCEQMRDAPIAPNGTVPHPRLLGHVSLLLPDRRVFVGGGTNVGLNIDPPYPTVPGFELSGEVFSPPYLFMPDNPRPTIVMAPNELTFDGPTFQIQVTRGLVTQEITSIVLIRPGSISENFDSDQRYIELEFTLDHHGPDYIDFLNVTPPAHDLGPTGEYMMFANIQRHVDGSLTPPVPSIAHWIRMN
jgi:hypothetical protein